ncbi:hypothetical protein [uncultured Aliivibrio sp.]|uniref:hypothetical protein n=1 Tax=uncultured Aliivibrio sp. TaxID=873085 RepID=UPI00260BB6F3|nr:hypothetical protein [uncultured Aliivibrio sp.]
MTIPNCSISDARDLVSNLNNISLFMSSGSLESGDEIFDMLLARLQDKIETLDSCLSYIVNAPLIEAERLLEEVKTK